ncbi:DUF3592 domain-containing protein [Hymenobacter baengnokdamensis]|uniref:DUF3592 domain-containing protein n=1 Tax=Hymenobacter baengnokdamensis TaxID=2615203 RepID=UPI0012488512|nr:DUF3592 domain-containing protein [Hymenobacter baengnokdamensis]
MDLTSSISYTFLAGCAVVGGIRAVRRITNDIRQGKQLQVRGVQTQGTVVRNKLVLSKATSSFTPVIRPVICFKTEEGETIEAVDYSGWAMAVPRFSKGTKVMVRYDPIDPTNFERL